MKRVLASVDILDVEEGYMIDVIETVDNYEAWIYKQDLGAKMLMWGSPKRGTDGRINVTYGDFMEAVCASYDRFKEIYDGWVDDIGYDQ